MIICFTDLLQRIAGRNGGVKLQVTLITGRTIEQGASKEKGKASKEYVDSTSVCYVDAEDLKKLGIKENTNILVSTAYGRVVVKALESSKVSVGLILVPYGPWANAIVDHDTDSIGMPSLKGIPAEIRATKDRVASNLRELIKNQHGK